MIAGQRLLGLVIARAGSVRIKDKNARDLAGRSLLERTVAEALAACALDQIGLTTDSDRYADLARAAGLDEPYRRPPALAGANAAAADAALDYLEWRERQGTGGFSHLVLLQPTSPFRTAAQIDGAIDTWRSSGKPGLVSVTPAAPAANLVVSLDDAGRIVRDGRMAYVLDGAIYITGIDALRATGRFWDADSAIYINHYPVFYDIDVEADFIAADALARSDALPVAGGREPPP